jgi:hypothetical protein
MAMMDRIIFAHYLTNVGVLILEIDFLIELKFELYGIIFVPVFNAAVVQFFHSCLLSESIAWENFAIMSWGRWFMNRRWFMNMFFGVNTIVKGGGEMNDISPGAVGGVTSAFGAVGDTSATPAAIAAPVAPPMRTSGE